MTLRELESAARSRSLGLGHTLSAFKVQNVFGTVISSAKCSRCGAWAAVAQIPAPEGREEDGRALTDPCIA